jgi:penicillin G amidase
VTESYGLDGLDGTIEILVDRWGVPHIYACSIRDACFAQGFNIARDRLWQLDLWRRAGLGTLSEVLGPTYVERDRAARLFLYRGSMQTEWAAYGCDLGPVLRPFVAGINAYVDQVARVPALLPPEFEVLRYTPSTWSPEDVLRIRAHGHYRNLRKEVARAQTLHRHGVAAEALRARLEPDAAVVVPEGVDLAQITPEVLRTYDLATGSALSPGAGASAASSGSNNWVIAGDRTATGRPILGNDPHRALTLPSLRYLVHVSAPGFEFAGGGEPMLPGISFGHNGHAAFGLTVLPIDHEDLYVYEVDDSANQYRYGAGWEAIEVERHRIDVRDAEPEEVELRFTRHGPIIYEPETDNVAFAVRAAWLDAGMVPYLGSVSLLTAHGWEEFCEAAAHWGTPGENLVYADVEGDIGWRPAGRAPVRPNWNGLLPVPGDGSYEWDGYAIPSQPNDAYNPARGWIATANQFCAELASPSGVSLGFEWEPPFRQHRIEQVLGSGTTLSVEDSLALQNDYLCLPAQQLLPLLRELDTSDVHARAALALLSGWDGRLEADSTAATLFELWFREHLRSALFARVLEGRVSGGVQQAVRDVLADETVVRDPRIDLDLVASLEPGPDTLASTLRAAMVELEQGLGPDRDRWKWGALHHASLAHLLEESAPQFRVLPPMPRGGGCDTVGNTGYGPGGYAQNVGATVRVVIDVGGWDNSVAINSPGQSGNPASEHYDDLLAPWARDEAVPFVYSREAVESVTEHRLLLSPTGSRPALPERA